MKVHLWFVTNAMALQEFIFTDKFKKPHLIGLSRLAGEVFNAWCHILGISQSGNSYRERY